jgi:hypothetical protein
MMLRAYLLEWFLHLGAGHDSGEEGVGAGDRGDLPIVVVHVRPFEIKNSKKTRVHFKIFGQNKIKKIQSNKCYKIQRMRNH